MSVTLSTLLGTGSVSGPLDRIFRNAALGGQSFWAAVAEDGLIRRWVAHAFPGRDEPWHEDLGLGPEDFAVEGILIGDDVLEQAEAMREMFRKPGPKQLEHHLYGELQVAVLDLRIRQSQDKRRVAFLNFTCQRYGTKPAPEVAEDFLGRLNREIDELMDEARTEVGRIQRTIARYDRAIGRVLGVVQGVASSVLGLFNGSGLAAALSSTVTGRAIAGLVGLAGGSGATFMSDVASALTALPRALSHQAGGAAVLSPAAFATATSSPPAVLETLAQPRAAFVALTRLAEAPPITVPAPVLVPGVGPVPGPGPGATSSQVQTFEAVRALRVLLQVSAGCEAARAAAEIPFVSREEAIAARDQVAAVLDQAADEATSAGLVACWRAATTIRAQSIREIGVRAARLPVLQRLTLPATMSATLLAYRLDGDDLDGLLDRAAALAARTGARHPSFVPGGVELEVER
ncbi:DNA circularization N-terminal domain-containing protein [Pararoseomonas sp. SCSIO 73927]|uniref:DNA circularization N-terminal domain-containing protein n=1 Tax=Pararoseomonas sp. SCSIO 73927 TaxID=3114537 RepID=UPI0030D2ED17